MRFVRAMVSLGLCILTGASQVGCATSEKPPPKPTYQELIAKYADAYRAFAMSQRDLDKATAESEEADKAADSARKEYFEAKRQAAEARKVGAPEADTLEEKTKAQLKKLLTAENVQRLRQAARTAAAAKNFDPREHAYSARARYNSRPWTDKSTKDIQKLERAFVAAANSGAPEFTAELEKRRKAYFAAYDTLQASDKESDDAYKDMITARKQLNEKSMFYENLRANDEHTGLPDDLKAVDQALQNILDAKERLKEAEKHWLELNEQWKELQKDYEKAFHAVLELPLM